jgi:hypothetical protein
MLMSPWLGIGSRSSSMAVFGIVALNTGHDRAPTPAIGARSLSEMPLAI